MRAKTIPGLLALLAIARIPAEGQGFRTFDLRAAISNAGPNSRVNIPAGVYDVGNTPIRIEGKRGVEIIGAGEGRTVIRAGASAPFIFEMAGSNTDLTVASMTLEGATRLATNTHGLAVGSDRVSLTGARFHNLDIRNVAVGISVANSSSGACNDIQITNNHLDNIQDVVQSGGVTAGSGYGIHNDGCTEVRIADNVLRNVDRHSIYQARAYQPNGSGPGSIIIDHNLIIDHAKTSSLHDAWLVAIVVARSSNVTVSRNVIVNPYHDAMSIEDAPEEGQPLTIRNISLIDNTVLGSRGADIFLTAGGSYTISGNRFYHSDANGSPSTPFIRRDGRGVSGRLVESPPSSNAQVRLPGRIPGSGPLRGVAAYGSKLYVYSGSCHYEVASSSGAATMISC
jgi:parallel beta helix pectate lyase-like protein